MISVVLVLLVSISMLVGAIGIMNVMLVAVTQRTREIGVLRALGATKWHIRLQFLIEASSISGLGAMVGLVLGVSLANIFVKLTFDDVNDLVLPFWPMLFAVGVALLVGVLAGAWPAMRAAQLDPIEALAAE
jgi:putative ABC transport system permease protein